MLLLLVVVVAAAAVVAVVVMILLLVVLLVLLIFLLLLITTARPVPRHHRRREGREVLRLQDAQEGRDSGYMRNLGIQTVIPTPDFRISPGGRKHRKTQDNDE